MHVNRQRKVLLKVGYACNNRCVFCHSAPYRGRVDAPTRSLAAKITAARLRGFEMVVFSGGEATIRPDLGALVRRVRAEGMALGFVTNGRRFADPRFLAAMQRCALGYVYMSLHGARAETHDRLVGARAHAEALAAVRALARVPDLQLTVNTVVTAWNVEELRGIVDLVLDAGGLRVKFSYLEPKGDALPRLDELQLPPTEVAAAVRDAMAYGESRAAARGVEMAWDALPFCLMEGLEDRYDDLRTNRIEEMSEAFETAFFPVDHLNKGQAPACAACARRDDCPGLYHEALERYGAECLRPLAARDSGG